jgi:ferredoxin--NADP+ reductase
LYAAEELTKAGAARVDVFDRLPAPLGLVRYGVAPDHEKVKSIVNTTTEIMKEIIGRSLGV